MRFRFVCESKLGGAVVFALVEEAEEHEGLFAAAPKGRIELGLLAADVVEAFEEGKEVFVDFKPGEP